MVRIFFIAFVLLIFGPFNIAFAQEGEAPAAEKPAEAAASPKEEAKETKKDEAAKKDESADSDIPPEAKEHQKAAEEVFRDTKKIAENLKPAEQKHFFLLYNNYNLIGTVKMVEGDVGNAIEACGKENPDMKEGLDTRFKEWKMAIDPVVKEAEINVNNMVIAQDYAKPEQIKKVFKGLDKTRMLASKQIEKTPVTTKDACEYLQEKMTDTQDNFVRLLKETLISVPQATPAENAEPAAGEGKNEEKKEEPLAKDEKPAEGPAAEE